MEKKEYYKVKVDELKNALAQIIFAVSSSETRMELAGVFFDLKKDALILAATDSYRLAEKNIKINSNGTGENKIIVPAKTLQELIRILSAVKAQEIDGTKNEIEFYVSENQILFSVGNIELVSRLIEGQYPDYKQIIPEAPKTKVMVNKSELLRAIKAAAIFSKTGINDVNLDFPVGKKEIIITSTSSQVGENITRVEAEIKGNDNGIVINYRYLLDGINNIDSENIRIEIIDSSTPCLLKNEKTDDYLYVIMPIKQ